MIMTIIRITHYSFFFNLQVFYWLEKTILNKDDYYHYYRAIILSTIFKLTKKEEKNFHYSLPKKYERVKVLYNSLLNLEYSTCQAFHEAMKLLSIINPQVKLSEVSQKTFDIIYPIEVNYYENDIDNHSQN